MPKTESDPALSLLSREDQWAAIKLAGGRAPQWARSLSMGALTKVNPRWAHPFPISATSRSDEAPLFAVEIIRRTSLNWGRTANRVTNLRGTITSLREWLEVLRSTSRSMERLTTSTSLPSTLLGTGVMQSLVRMACSPQPLVRIGSLCLLTNSLLLWLGTMQHRHRLSRLSKQALNYWFMILKLVLRGSLSNLTQLW